MNYFRPSMIATVVASALTVGTVGAVNAAPINSLNIDTATLARIAQINAVKQATVNQTTVSGMKNQFDAKLNKTTFVWQNKAHVRPEMIMVAPEQRNAYAAGQYLSSLTGMTSGKGKNSQAVLQEVHDINRGAIIARYNQQVNGIEVFNHSYNVMMDRDHNLVAGSGYFADVDSKTLSLSKAHAKAAFGSPLNAIATAFQDMGGSAVELSVSKTKNDYTLFSVDQNATSEKQLVGEPRSKQVYFEQKGKMIAAHYVEVQVSEPDSVDSEYYSFVISGKNQEILFKNNLTAHSDEFSYRAYAATTAPYAPWDSPLGNVSPAESADQVDPSTILDAPMVTLTSGPISTNDPWLVEGATETIGNNVVAYVDAISPTGLSFGDYTAEITSAGTFDYAIDTSEKEYSINNRKAAIVNLFYMNNYLHDQFYDHGFNEAAGNAQMENWDRGGEGGDALNAEVQDNSGLNNANMTTPADGSAPQMQMYLWTQAQNGVHFGVTVQSHPEIGVLDSTGGAGFGIQDYDITGDVVRIDDGVVETDGAAGTVKDGCEAATNADALAGKIALIDRGACSFTAKVKNAQDAGAIAVLVANNRDGDLGIGLGGDDDSITIPSRGISQNVGIALDGLLDNGETVTVNLVNDSNVPFRASSWDNAIVAHEWGHFISNRLIGNANGLSNNQGRSMGEGWGDFHALLITSSADESSIVGNDMYQKPYAGISYVASLYRGIRKYPYTTDMEINKHTFASITENPAVHASGNVWATMLWGAFVGLINDDRFDYTTAKSQMMDYLVAGYKMTPNAPTMVEARDAILAAAYAHNTADYDIILAAFATRGLGLGAVAPHRNSTDHSGVVESYDTTRTALTLTSHTMDVNYEGMTTGYCSNDNILDKGESGTATFTATNMGSEAFAGVTGMIEVTSGHDVTFANGGVVTFGDLGVTGSATATPVEFMLNEAGMGEMLEMKVTFPDLGDASGSQEYMISSRVNYDFKALALEGTSAHTGAETLAIENDFKEHVMAGGDMAIGTGGLTHAYSQFWKDLGVDMGDGSLFIKNHGFYSDVAYETAPITVGMDGNFQMNWIHYWNFEDSFDGGVIEISINGEAWLDVLDAGGQFLGPGYNGSLIAHSSQPLPDRAAYTGIGAAFEAVAFGTFLNGNSVRMRFRAGSDGGANVEGWLIDDISFDQIVTDNPFSEVVAGDLNACDNRLPYLSVSEGVTLNEGASATLTATAVDANAGDTLTYHWSQVSGPEGTLAGADTMDVTFTAPAVTADDHVELMVTVSDGHGSVSKSVMLTVSDVPVVVAPTPTPAPVVSSSSGSTGLISLLLLPMAFMRRRFMKK